MVSSAHADDEQLIEIPNSALFNVRTLTPLWETTTLLRTLSAVQLLSLHLALFRNMSTRKQDACPHPLFLPFLASLPTKSDFAAHPVWLLNQEETRTAMQEIAAATSVDFRLYLAEINARFLADWTRVEQAWAS